jgi:stress response protein YsnF
MEMPKRKPKAKKPPVRKFTQEEAKLMAKLIDDLKVKQEQEDRKRGVMRFTVTCTCCQIHSGHQGFSD